MTSEVLRLHTVYYVIGTGAWQIVYAMLRHFFSINLQTEIISTKTSDLLKQMIFSSHLILCCLCNGLKQKRVIVPHEIHEGYPGKNIYRKDPKFLDRLSGQTVQTEVSLLLRNPSD